MAIFLSCEHAGNSIPSMFRRVFRDAKDDLESHRGLDIGAFALGKSLARHLDRPLLASTTSRLLVDLNRSLTNPTLFSEYSDRLSEAERRTILARYYRPYRRALENSLKRTKRFKTHLSLHSFTPVLHGKKRRCDIGILFDPNRSNEREFARLLRENLSTHLVGWKIHFNSPYKGTGDGLTTDMRRIFSDDEYAGVEIEVRQDHLTKLLASKKLTVFAKIFADAVEESILALDEARRS